MINVKKTPEAEPLNEWQLLLILVYSPGYRIPTTACLCDSYDLSEDGVLTMIYGDTITKVEEYSWFQVFDGTNEEFTNIFNGIEKIVKEWTGK